MHFLLIIAGIALLIFYRNDSGFNKKTGKWFILAGVAFFLGSVVPPYVAGVNQLGEVRLGMRLYHAGHYPQAINVMEKVIQGKVEAGKLDAALCLSKAYSRMGHAEKADHYYAMALLMFEKERKALEPGYGDVEGYWRQRSEAVASFKSQVSSFK